MRGSRVKLLCRKDMTQQERRAAKRAYVDAKRIQTPKLEVNPRWLRSPLHRAKMTSDGLHLSHHHPIRSIHSILNDLTKQGVEVAFNISRRGDLPKVVLIQRISELRELYGKGKPQQERRELRSESDES